MKQPNCICEKCGNKFWKQLSKIKAAKANFCSRICYQSALTDQSLLPKLTKTGSSHYRAMTDKQKKQSNFTRFLDIGWFVTDTGCWNWEGEVADDGYGKIWDSVKEKGVPAHRIGYEYANGYIDEDLFVLHQCDNKQCVNPAHLTQGDNRQNQIEAVERGLTGDLVEKRKQYFKSLTETEFEKWKINKRDGNVTTAENYRRN